MLSLCFFTVSVKISVKVRKSVDRIDTFYCFDGADTGFGLNLQNGCYQLQMPFLCGFLALSEFG